MTNLNKEFDFIKNRKTCAIIAACVLLFGLIFNIIFPDIFKVVKK